EDTHDIFRARLPFTRGLSPSFRYRAADRSSAVRTQKPLPHGFQGGPAGTVCVLKHESWRSGVWERNGSEATSEL
ncbi:uncharacterized protein METZ01_LOCUS181445, partial [marine metagenome]